MNENTAQVLLVLGLIAAAVVLIITGHEGAAWLPIIPLILIFSS